MSSWLAHPASRPLTGELRVPSDKSITHRAVMLGAVARGTTVITNPLGSEDARATVAAVKALGASIVEHGNVWEVTGCAGKLARPTTPIDCGNAGTLIRLVAGLICGRNVDCVLDGDASLRKRPMRRISDPLNQMGAMITASEAGTPPLHIQARSKLSHIEYTLPKASAQIKSAVLLAALCSEGGATVIEPQLCRDHTERILPSFGVEVSRAGDAIKVEQLDQLDAATLEVPADISSAAFYMVAATIVPGSELVLRDVCINPTRTGIIDLLLRMGASIELCNERMLGPEPAADIRVRHSELKAIDIGPDDVPGAIDELPVLLVAASMAAGTTILSGAEELRTKESDRLSAMASALGAAGVPLVEHQDGIEVTGGTLSGAEVDSVDDHRIAMAMAVAALAASSPIKVHGTTNVRTSFPNFEKCASAVGWQIDPV